VRVVILLELELLLKSLPKSLIQDKSKSLYAKRSYTSTFKVL
jgi:hypothetical protein